MNTANFCPSSSRENPSAANSSLAPILKHFDGMIDRCLEYAEAAKTDGRPVVGIMCEFTPRELIMAAGGVPVCLCGGSQKTIPAAEQVLPSDVCPLIKSTFGYHLLNSNPFLKMADLIVAETTCDAKKKMFELLGASRPMHVLELPQKSENEDSRARWVQEVRKLKSRLEEQFAVTITDQALRDAIQLMNRERRLRRELSKTMSSDHPPLTGCQLNQFKSIISAIAADLHQYEAALEHLAELPPPNPSARRKVRVLLTGVPMVHGAERVLELIECCGAVVVATESCTGLKPILGDVDESDPDPVAAIARKYYHLPCSVMTPNSGRFNTLKELAVRFRADCVIDLVWEACLTYDVESYSVRKMAEEELHLPYLKITTDYSPSDSARIISRVEALVETAGARRMT